MEHPATHEQLERMFVSENMYKCLRNHIERKKASLVTSHNLYHTGRIQVAILLLTHVYKNYINMCSYYFSSVKGKIQYNDLILLFNMENLNKGRIDAALTPITFHLFPSTFVKMNAKLMTQVLRQV